MKTKSLFAKFSILALMFFALITLLPQKAYAVTYPSLDSIQRYWYNGHLYAVVDNPTDEIGFTGLEQYAESLGGHLVYVESAGENQFINNLVERYGTHPYYALGMSRVGSGFKYFDGRDVVYTNWLPNEPDNAGGEPYVELYKGTNGMWNDIPNYYRGSTEGAVIEWDVNDAVLRVDGEKNSVKAGEFIDLDVKINNKDEWQNLNLGLGYNSSILKLVNAESVSGLKVTRNKIFNGGLLITLTSKDGTPIENGAIVKLRFKALTKGSTDIYYNFAQVNKPKVVKTLSKYVCVPKTITVS